MLQLDIMPQRHLTGRHLWASNLAAAQPEAGPDWQKKPVLCLHACNLTILVLQCTAILLIAASVVSTGRAVAYLAQQQMDIAASPYLQLKPLVLNTSKGTLERLSDLPGWKRQSARKKWAFIFLRFAYFLGIHLCIPLHADGMHSELTMLCEVFQG